MNELIKIHTNSDMEQIVSARELHEKLGAKQDFTNWFKYQAEKLGIEEGRDFTLNLAQSTGGRPSVDFLIPIDTAKHLAMISGGEKAHEIRQYFIKVEKAWNDPEMVMARAQQISQRKLIAFESKIKQLETKVEADKPKVIFADAVTESKTSILIGDLAKIIKQNGVNIGQKRLFEWLRAKGYLMKSGQSKNMPTQRSMEMGLFEVKESVIVKPYGENLITRTTKVTGKGQMYLINALLNEPAE